jgi:hypothetical protein
MKHERMINSCPLQNCKGAETGLLGSVAIGLTWAQLGADLHAGYVGCNSKTCPDVSILADRPCSRFLRTMWYRGPLTRPGALGPVSGPPARDPEGAPDCRILG